MKILAITQRNSTITQNHPLQTTRIPQPIFTYHPTHKIPQWLTTTQKSPIFAHYHQEIPTTNSQPLPTKKIHNDPLHTENPTTKHYHPLPPEKSQKDSYHQGKCHHHLLSTKKILQRPIAILKSSTKTRYVPPFKSNLEWHTNPLPPLPHL